MSMPGWMQVLFAAGGVLIGVGIVLLVRLSHVRYVNRTYFSTLFMPEDDIDQPPGAHRRIT